MLWVPLIFAIIDPVLSSLNATDKIRKIIYGVAGLTQTGGMIGRPATGLSSTGGQIAPIVGVGVLILSAFLGHFYTPTTTMVPKAMGVMLQVIQRSILILIKWPLIAFQPILYFYSFYSGHVRLAIIKIPTKF